MSQPSPITLILSGLAPDDDRLTFFRTYADRHNARLCLVDDDDATRTIDHVLHAPSKMTATRSQRGGPTLLLMEGLNDDAMRALLQAMRSANVAIELKAIVTPTNRRWTLQALRDELAQEHALIQAWQALTELVTRCDQLLMEPAVLLDEGGFEADVDEARTFVRNGPIDATLDTITDRHDKLVRHLTRLGY